MEKLLEILEAHKTRRVEVATERPDGRYEWHDQIVCDCGQHLANADAVREHLAYMLKPLLAEVWESGSDSTTLDYNDFDGYLVYANNPYEESK